MSFQGPDFHRWALASAPHFEQKMVQKYDLSAKVNRSVGGHTRSRLREDLSSRHGGGLLRENRVFRRDGAPVHSIRGLRAGLRLKEGWPSDFLRARSGHAPVHWR